jgi:hypothetical protein
MNGGDAPRPLADLQQWMQAVITHPDGVQGGIRSAAAREAIDLPPEELDRIVAPSKSLDSARRLGIYANAYFARLLECLREEFPALRRAVGENAFAAFVAGYLQQRPSQSYTLAELGRSFPKFLEETRPADNEPRPNWTDFVIELARVERVYADVFDGPGIEQLRVLQPEDLITISPERWTSARLVPAPCLRLLELTHPVHEYITAVRKQQLAPVPEPAATWLVISRRDYVVRRTAVSQDEYSALASLVAGKPVGDAILSVMNDENEGTLAGDLQNWFHHWAAAGYFIAVSLP